MGRTNLLPILKNPAAPRKGLKLRWARSTGRTPAGALMGRVEDLVDAAGQLARARSAYCDRVHLFGSCVRIHSECPSWMRSDAAGLWKPKVLRSVIRIVFRKTLAGTGFPFS